MILKLTSFMAAMEQPATMGIREYQTAGANVWPRSGPERTTENTGSAALITCVNDTAILLKLTHAETCPTVWKKATGATANRKTFDTTGFGWTFVAHTVNIHRLVAASCKVEINHGYGNTFKVDLLYTLKTMLKKYHRKKYTAVLVWTLMFENGDSVALATVFERALGVVSTTELRTHRRCVVESCI